MDILRQCIDCNLLATNEEDLLLFVKGNIKEHMFGRRNICNTCNNIRRRKLRKEKRIEAIINKGGICVRCGIEYNGTNATIFDFHHTNPTNKSRPGTFDMATLSRENYLKEVGKCILLCANCHRIEHQEEY